MRHRLAPAAALPALLLASVASAQCLLPETQRLAPAGLVPGDELGIVTAIDGDLCAAGALTDDAGADSGSVFVHRFDHGLGAWMPDGTLQPDDAHAGLQFIHPSIAGPVIVVGAYGDDDGGAGAGAAYVFRFDGAAWQQEAKLVASDAAPGDGVGVVHTTGALIAVAAPNHDGAATNAGAVYVHRHDGAAWVEEAILTADDASPDAYLGYPVWISGDRIIAGAYGDNGFQGAAYIFRHDGAAWVQEAKLTGSDTIPGDTYGLVATIHDDVAVVGAIDADGVGAAYIYRFDPCTGAWNEDAKLTASDAQAGASFGSDIGIRKDMVLISAWLHDVDGHPDAGAVYAFEHSNGTWTETARIVASDVGADLWFGNSVALSGDAACLGGRGSNGSRGAAYIVRGLDDRNRNGVLDVCDLAAGTSMDLNGDGIVDECQRQRCAGDLDGDGVVGPADLATLLGAWGGCP